MDADAIVVGAGLAGLVAAAELADAGCRVLLLDQESEANLGGQAFWSLGGLFFVDSPEQRLMGVRDSHASALADWQRAAGFDRDEDCWGRRWAEAYVDFASGEKRAWLRAQGMRWFPVVGWAERGFNSVPRFHLTWGTGPGVLAPFVRRVREAAARGLVTFAFRHRVDALNVRASAVTGVRGTVLEPSDAPRGVADTRRAIAEFAFDASAVVVTSGGIGANHALVRAHWPARLGTPPQHMLSGVPAYVDGAMLGVAREAGGTIVNADRMWHYVEGVRNWDPIWPNHGIRILPGPSSLWLDALGTPLPAPLFPGFDTLGTLAYLRSTGYDYSWFVLTQKIIEKEFALSGSEQNPDITGKSVQKLLRRVLPGAPAPVEAFKRHGEDFVVAKTLRELLAGMNAKTDAPLLDERTIEAAIVARDAAIAGASSDHPQIAAIRNARAFRSERLLRVAKPHRLLDPASGPLIAVKLHVLTRKTLGGLQTDLDARVLRADGAPLPGLYAAGEVSGFGGGGMHGYRALEGTFLGGCIFTGRTAGRAIAKLVR